VSLSSPPPPKCLHNSPARTCSSPNPLPPPSHPLSAAFPLFGFQLGHEFPRLEDLYPVPLLAKSPPHLTIETPVMTDPPFPRKCHSVSLRRSPRPIPPPWSLSPSFLGVLLSCSDNPRPERLRLHSSFPRLSTRNLPSLFIGSRSPRRTYHLSAAFSSPFFPHKEVWIATVISSIFFRLFFLFQ